MSSLEASHFSDDALLRDAKVLVAQGFMTTAALLTRIAEIDRRMLYRREGYDSLYAYCLHELHLSDDAACRRIKAARIATRFPAVLVALADGRLHMRAALMLERHLTRRNADELVAAATHKTREEIALLLAQRFPRPDLPERLQAIPAPSPIWAEPAREPMAQPAPERVEVMGPEQGACPQAAHLPAPERVEAPVPRPKVMPLAPERFGLQVTIDSETHELLRRAQALMSHQVPAGDIATVLKSALQRLVEHLEKRKFAATDRPGPSRPCTSRRHVPAAVKRAVRERDGDQCAFVSDNGRRCTARTHLQFDHIEPVARGGEATVDGIRLCCRAHNQYAAERAFGSGFMSDKRAEAMARAKARKQAGVRKQATARAAESSNTVEMRVDAAT